MELYHDTEWGVPVYDDRKLFEFLILEGAQAGLSWNTVLLRREAYRHAFYDFDPVRVAKITPRITEKLLHPNSEIIKNRRKVMSVVQNAKNFLQIQKEFGSFSTFLWNFVDDIPIQNTWKTHNTIPVMTDVSLQLSKALKKRGFSFVGPTIMYAYMQAVGMVNDHTTDCFRYSELKKDNADTQ